MNPTKEEKNLCKQIAEKHKKPLKNFDLVVGTHLSGEEFIGYYHEELTKERSPKTRLDEVMVGLCETARSTKELIPLWTISDCLEFILKKGWNIEEFFKNKGGTFSFHIQRGKYLFLKGKEDYQFKTGKTPLEACLKAVLAVVEEMK